MAGFEVALDFFFVAAEGVGDGAGDGAVELFEAGVAEEVFGGGLERFADELGNAREDGFLEEAVDGLGLDFVAGVGEDFEAKAELGGADEIGRKDEGETVGGVGGLHEGAGIGLGEGAFRLVGIGKLGDDEKTFLGA